MEPISVRVMVSVIALFVSSVSVAYNDREER
jgi:hypothetical protein